MLSSRPWGDGAKENRGNVRGEPIALHSAEFETVAETAENKLKQPSQHFLQIYVYLT